MAASLAALVVNQLKTDTISRGFFELKTKKSLQLESLFDVAKCEDEAVLAMALRKHAKDFVGVADDGKSLFLKDHDTLMDALEDWDSKCVYLEKSGPTEKLDESFLRENMLSAIDASEIEDIVALPQFKAAFAFIRFENAEIACKFVESFVWMGIDDRTHSKLQKVADLKNGVRRVLLKTKWNKKMIEYYSYAALQNSLLAAQHAVKKEHDRKDLEFQEGVIASFSGAHNETTARALKNLISLVVPVAFVDYSEADRGEGYVRFQSHQDALLAQSYFSRVCITQKHPHDGCGSLNAHQSRQHFRSWKIGRENGSQIVAVAGFSLRILEGWEQDNYWQQIFDRQADRQAFQAAGIVERGEMVIDEAEEDSAAVNDTPTTSIAVKRKKKSKTKASVHVIFESSDHDNDEEDLEECATTTIKPRKPRHRSSKRAVEGEEEVRTEDLQDTGKKRRKLQINFL